VTLERIENSKADYIVGTDEVGYGALAGPFVVGCVVAPKGWTWPGLRDSKKLSPAVRERIDSELEGKVFFHHEKMLARQIEKLGPLEALKLAHVRAIRRALQSFPNALVVVDGDFHFREVDCITLVKADTVVPAVMAASIRAKVLRDRYMLGLHQVYPSYGFNEHSGYGTEQHVSIIRAIGGSAVHRRNYKPWKDMLKAKDRTS
jgi:ribonuclease HII